MKPILRDSDLILRAVEPEDAEFMWEVEGDSLQWIFNCMAAPFSRSNLANYAATYEADPFLAEQIRFIITSMDDTRIGIIDLYEISAQHRNAYVGIYILPALRNKGYGKKALDILADYASRLLNLRNLGARITDGNPGSLDLFLKAGYTWAGTLNNWILTGDITRSLHILQKELR